MLKISNFEVMGWGHVIRGMRNPMNSWSKSDSGYQCPYKEENAPICGNCTENICIGPNDHDLMMKLRNAGTDHLITVYLDITAPLYWWNEFRTYCDGELDIIDDGYSEYDIEMNSCSTMHKIHEKEFTMEDFSYEHLMAWREDFTCNCLICEGATPDGYPYGISPVDALHTTIGMLNKARELYLETGNKQYWWQMIQLLPSSYNQTRTVMLNYEVLANIYKSRRNHKLDEWRIFCKWVEELPYSELITGENNEEESIEN